MSERSIQTIVKRKLRLVIVIAALIALAGLGYFLWRRSADKPECNCRYSQTGEYGVIKDGECVVVDCNVKQK